MPDIAVTEIMAKRVKALGRNAMLKLAWDLMSTGRFRHVPVLDGNRVVGVVSQRDIFRLAATAAVLGFGQGARRAILGTLRVKDVMTGPAITACPGTSVEEASRLMLEARIGCLPVVEDGILVGLVTRTDALRHLLGAGRAEPARIPSACGPDMARTA
jgi:acetoin utilization protein AcuB